jgi:hypothetical protein
MGSAKPLPVRLKRSTYPLEQYQPDPNREAILRLLKLRAKMSLSVSTQGGNALAGLRV